VVKGHLTFLAMGKPKSGSKKRAAVKKQAGIMKPAISKESLYSPTLWERIKAGVYENPVPVLVTVAPKLIDGIVELGREIIKLIIS
jgi:hypothetical protein